MSGNPEDSEPGGGAEDPTRLSEAEWGERATFLEEVPQPVQAAPESLPDPSAFAPPVASDSGNDAPASGDSGD
jgi:hypothetical protein